MAKDKKKGGGEEEECGESAPLWIISFADLVVLLMSFFVILSCGNTREVEFDPEYAKILAAIKQAFGYVPEAGSTDPIDLAILNGVVKLQKKRGTGIRGESEVSIPGARGRSDMVTTIRDGTKTVMGTKVMFDRDSTDIKPQALPALRDIARKIAGHMNVFVVKGHTSKDEEYRLRGSAQDISYTRAQAVASRLVAMGIAKEALRVQACRDYEPIKQGAYSETAWSANRRVEIQATEALISEFQGTRAEISGHPSAVNQPHSTRQTPAGHF